MEQHAHILICGRDGDLLSTRGLVLASAGYTISTTMQPIRTFSGLDGVQLLVVCHTLNAAEREQDLSTLGIASPLAKVLCLEPYPGATRTDIPGLDSFQGPREMVRVVNQLLPIELP